MSITEQENSLFKKWAKEQKYGDLFVKDGVSCPKEYEKAEYKIVYGI